MVTCRAQYGIPASHTRQNVNPSPSLRCNGTALNYPLGRKIIDTQNLWITTTGYVRSSLTEASSCDRCGRGTEATNEIASSTRVQRIRIVMMSLLRSCLL